MNDWNWNLEATEEAVRGELSESLSIFEIRAEGTFFQEPTLAGETTNTQVTIVQVPIG